MTHNRITANYLWDGGKQMFYNKAKKNDILGFRNIEK